jgi:hypothetical protein
VNGKELANNRAEFRTKASQLPAVQSKHKHFCIQSQELFDTFVYVNNSAHFFSSIQLGLGSCNIQHSRNILKEVVQIYPQAHYHLLIRKMLKSNGR